MPINALTDLDRIYQVRVHWVYRGEPGGECSFSFWSQREEPLTPADMYDAFAAELLPLFNAERPWRWIMDEVRVEDRFPQVQAPLVVSYPLGIEELGEGIGVPPQLSAVISWRTGEIGRSHRGRTYYGHGSVDDVEWENVVGGFNDNVVAFADQMVARFCTGGSDPFFRFVIVSRQHDGMPDAPGHWTPVTHYLYNFKWATMRRRGNPWWAEDPYFGHH